MCSYVIKNNYKNKDEFDWVEFPNTKYFNDVVSKINFDKFPKLEKYMLDIDDEADYNYIAIYLMRIFLLDMRILLRLIILLKKRI